MDGNFRIARVQSPKSAVILVRIIRTLCLSTTWSEDDMKRV